MVLPLSPREREILIAARQRRLEQGDCRSSQPRRRHGQEPRDKYSHQTRRAGPHTGGHPRPSIGNRLEARSAFTNAFVIVCGCVEPNAFTHTLQPLSLRSPECGDRGGSSAYRAENDLPLAIRIDGLAGGWARRDDRITPVWSPSAGVMGPSAGEPHFRELEPTRRVAATIRGAEAECVASLAGEAAGARARAAMARGRL